MEIVEVMIKIPKYDYDYILGQGDTRGTPHLAEAICNGTVLPKGHGRLFDEKNCCTISGLISPENSIPIIEADEDGE